MDSHLIDVVMRLGAALAAGSMIGMERSYHGRPAGFRTHTLVCLASALLMLVTVYESQWFQPQGNSRVVVDPTRMAQGIMTGIGFLGAGVIMKEGLAVRGLTTAASIWVTSAIGILLGIGFWIPAMIAVAATLGTLSSFRWIESRMPTEFYAQFRVQFRREEAMPEKELRMMVAEYGFTVANLNYVLTKDGERFEYRMVLRTLDSSNTPRLARRLGDEQSVVEFRIAPIGS